MHPSSTLTPGPRRLRSRTATVSFGSGNINGSLMAPGENHQEVDAVPDLAEVGGARFDSGRLEPRLPGRKSSKSVSGTRPPLSTSASSHRAFYPETLGGPSTGSSSPQAGGRTRNGLKRRISTPNLAKRTLSVDDEEPEPQEQTPLPSTLSATSNVTAFETRARSTSTSIVVPNTLTLEPESLTQPVQTLTYQPHPIITTTLPTPPPWASMYLTPPSPATTDTPQPPAPPSGVLNQVYDLGESVVTRVWAWAQPRHTRERRGSRRSSDEDSEKGLDGSEPETFEDEDEGQERVGLGHTGGRYWGLFSDEDDTYFTLPPTPPDDTSALPFPQSLPTPALSTQSLSRGSSRRRSRRSRSEDLQGGPADGWWVRVYRTWISSGTGTGKTTEVLRELGWTVALLAGLFVVSFLLVIYALHSMPITHLQSMPKSTTDLQLLSAEIRAYMTSSNSGWWHTVSVLTYIGCWKHAWSVPGAVVLNILVGSVFDPVPALLLLTLITACGSLGAYSLSRPLAPLIAVLFPKPLALVRAALAPQSVPRAPGSTVVVNGETVTPLQVSDDPADPPLGGTEDRPNVWRRLLLMRAMGFVPWSGMNVACGVVGVDWRTFWLTTAAGSASWSYVTASVGNILSRLALPASAAAAEENPGESLTSLLRDPTLIAKLFFLTLLTLVPVLLKRRANPAVVDVSDDDSEVSTPLMTERPSALGLDTSGISTDDEAPPSPLATSLATFTPTPAVFDLLSFGRTAMRQGVRFVAGSARNAVGNAQRLVGNLRS